MGKGKINETTMNTKLAKISLNEYDLLQCLNYWPNSMPSRNSSYVALVTPHPKHSLPSLEKRHLRASLPRTPLSGTPRRMCHRRQKAGLAQRESGLREHAGHPPQAKKHPPKRCSRAAGHSPLQRQDALTGQQIVVHRHCRLPRKIKITRLACR